MQTKFRSLMRNSLKFVFIALEVVFDRSKIFLEGHKSPRKKKLGNTMGSAAILELLKNPTVSRHYSRNPQAII